jgi:hypothetical protein
MYYEAKLEFQIAARKRAARNPIRSACSLAANRPPQGSTFLAVFAPTSLSKLGYGLLFTIHKSRVTGHGFLIVTPRLEFPATVTKQSPGRISNRYKIAVFSSELPVHPRNRREPSPREFRIANLGLEFFLNIAKSIKYNFLIANKRVFCIRRGGSRFGASESLFAYRNLSSENWMNILAVRLKTRIGVSRRSLVKVKSLLCYGDSHFQLCKMLTNSPSVIFGEN